MTRKKSYQKGHVVGPIRTRSGGKYILRYRVRTADGKWKQKAETLYGLKGKKEAWAVLGHRIRESLGSVAIEAQDLTLTQFVDTYWRPYLDRKQVKPSTRQGYDSMLHLHIAPVLGGFRLREIGPLHIEQLLQKGSGGVSPKTQRNIVVLLQGIFSLALENDLIEKSPVRGKHKPTVPKRPRPCWTAEQIRAIVQSAPRQFHALFVCAGLTGSRLGELLGLQWKHVDLESRKLRIEQSLWHDQLVLPKTEGSTGALLFDDVLAQTLAEHRRGSNHDGPNDFVFCRSDGSPLNPDVLRKDLLYPVLDRLGIARDSIEMEGRAAQLVTESKKGTSEFCPEVPMVAGACNVPNALILPYRMELVHSTAQLPSMPRVARRLFSSGPWQVKQTSCHLRPPRQVWSAKFHIF